MGLKKKLKPFLVTIIVMFSLIILGNEKEIGAVCSCYIDSQIPPPMNTCKCADYGCPGEDTCEMYPCFYASDDLCDYGWYGSYNRYWCRGCIAGGGVGTIYHQYFSGPECTGCEGGCFTPEVGIETDKGEKAIGELEIGEQVKSLELETGKEATSVVEKIYKTTRDAYYKLTLKDGKEVSVTAEHPLYAIRQEDKSLTFWEYLKTESLTRKAITYLHGKFQ